jgi:adenylate cyclase
MSLGLESLAPCFQGLIPATLYTCSLDGIPNVAYLSHIDYVDQNHVALSFQFFNKSRRNIAENPQALVRVIDPDTWQGWALRLRYIRSETSGPVFDRMALRIEAIASYSGLKGIFKLLAADIYEVLSVAKCAEEPGVDCRPGRRQKADDPVFTMRALQDLSQRIHQADSLDRLLDSILEGLETVFGFSHSMILLPGEEDGVLVTVASRGYPEAGVGAEVRIGEGIIGVVAEARKPIRISGLIRELLYAAAVSRRAQEVGMGTALRRIPLPGMRNPQSQLGVPLLVRGELIGVLCIESETRYRFHEEDKASIELLGSYLAIAIQNMVLRERAEMPVDVPTPAPAPAKPPCCRNRCEVTYYNADECITIDGEYVVRSLPAKIFWKLVSMYKQSGRTEFTNRELRLDKSLNLPEYKDNLETRLLLLRRRLEQKCSSIGLVPTGRGRFALRVDCEIGIVERP